MSLAGNSNQLFLPGGCNKLAKWPIYLSLAPTLTEIVTHIDQKARSRLNLIDVLVSINSRTCQFRFSLQGNSTLFCICFVVC